jgi:DNA-binding HxlR family transcriptional regulator
VSQKSLANLECPIAQSLDVIGDRWSLLILRDALDGFTRFDEFEANLGIAPNTLSRRLTGLVDAGLLERTQYSDRPPRQEYVVTDRGRGLRPVLVALYAWGVRGQKPADRTMVLVDGESGNEIDPVLVDGRTGRPLAEVSATFAAGPAALGPIRERLDPQSRAQRRRRTGR